jgi:drug/metabolite transporter (DMT)-like permease
VNPRTAELLLLLVTCLWGATFAFVKDAVTVMAPTTFVAVRFALATAVFVCVWPQVVRGWNMRLVRDGAILGVLFAAGFLLQTHGLTDTPASVSAFITGTMVVFVPFVVRLAGRGTIHGSHVAAVALVVVGLYVFLQPDVQGIGVGEWLTLASAVCWALYVVAIDAISTRYHHHGHEQHVLVFLQFLVTTLLAMALAPCTAQWYTIPMTPTVIVAIVYCAIAASIITTLLQTKYQRFTHPVRASIIFAAEPIVASIVAWFVLSEGWSARQTIGAAIVILGIIAPEMYTLQKQKKS